MSEVIPVPQPPKNMPIYYFTDTDFTRNMDKVQLWLDKKLNVYLRYLDSNDVRRSTSVAIKRFHNSSNGDCLIVFKNDKKMVVRKNKKMFRVISKPTFIQEGKETGTTDIIEAKRMVEKGKKIYAKFNEGKETLVKTSIIKSIELCPDFIGEHTFVTDTGCTYFIV